LTARAVVALLCGLGLACQACVEAPPRSPDDLCAIFAERGRWEQAAQGSEQRWEVPLPVMMAFVHQESRFEARARPAGSRLLGVLPLGPRSSAYGYGQVKDGTWSDYRRQTGKRHARRDEFADVIDFIGWYADQIHRVAGVGKTDAYHLYLAYHEGPGGFRRASYRGKAWLQQVARKVAVRAQRYTAQYRVCGAAEDPQTAAAQRRIQKRSGRHTASLPPSM